METKEIEARINHLTGNIMGLQTLLLSVIATSDKKDDIIKHFIEDARNTHAVLLAESKLPDDTLHQLDSWYATTIQMLLEDQTG